MNTSLTVERFIEAQNNLVVQHSDFSLRALSDMADNGSVELDPHYQRRERWSLQKQSALIESFILNVPVPPVYLSEYEFGRYSVIDGKQRITAVRDFLNDTLRLRDLKRFPELNGLTFSLLPLEIQNALTVRPYIRVITLLKQTDPDLKYEVFLRLNTGGDKLLPQEIRNVAFSGPLNDLLFELSSSPFLWHQMKIKNEHSLAFKKMEDVEHVLRFFTILENWNNMGQLLSVEMDRYMHNHRFASDGQLQDLSDIFLNSLLACEQIWGGDAFHKPQGNGWRSQFISPLFDAEMVAVSLFSQDQIDQLVHRREDLRIEFIAKFNSDEKFANSVSQSTNNPSSVKTRISTVRDLLAQFV